MNGIMSWEKLAEATRERRKDLGLTQTQVAERGALSISLLRLIENNRSGGRLSNPKAAGLERALEWRAGSVAAVLDGGSPTIDPNPITAAQEASVQASTVTRDGDRFALAHHVLALRETLTAHLSTIGQQARDALTAEMESSARDAERSIIQMMPWLGDVERDEAIELLVQLRTALPVPARE